MKVVTGKLQADSYGQAEVASSRISAKELQNLKPARDSRRRTSAICASPLGVFADQTEQIGLVKVRDAFRAPVCKALRPAQIIANTIVQLFRSSVFCLIAVVNGNRLTNELMSVATGF